MKLPSQEYLWTLERNLDADIQFQEDLLVVSLFHCQNIWALLRSWKFWAFVKQFQLLSTLCWQTVHWFNMPLDDQSTCIKYKFCELQLVVVLWTILRKTIKIPSRYSLFSFGKTILTFYNTWLWLWMVTMSDSFNQISGSLYF